MRDVFQQFNKRKLRIEIERIDTGYDPEIVESDELRFDDFNETATAFRSNKDAEEEREDVQ